MPPGKRWVLVSALVVGATLAYFHYRRRDLGRRFVENFRRYSAPNATLYDAVTAHVVQTFPSSTCPLQLSSCPLHVSARGQCAAAAARGLNGRRVGDLHLRRDRAILVGVVVARELLLLLVAARAAERCQPARDGRAEVAGHLLRGVAAAADEQDRRG